MAMRQTISKGLMAMAMLSLAACSSGGGGGNSHNGAEISGGALKGIIINGRVDAYPFKNGAFDETSSLANALTGNDGTYPALHLPNSYTGAVELKLTAVDGTQMKCDIPTGCPGGVAFGGLFPLPVGTFSLTALVPAAPRDATITANISPMTDMATALALSDPTFAADQTTAITNSNSQTANLFFGMPVNLLDYKVIDTTSPAAVAGASVADLNAALVSGAITTAIMTQSGATDSSGLRTAMTAFNTSFTGNKGQLVINAASASVVSLNNINQQMANVLAAAKALATAQGTPLTNTTAIDSLITSNNAVTNAVTPSDTTTTQSQPGQNPTGTLVDKATAFVTDITNIATSVIQPDGTVMLDANDFNTLKAAATASSPDAQALANATNYAVQAMGLAALNDIPTMADGTTTATFSETVQSPILANGVFTAPTTPAVISVDVTKNADNGYTLTVDGTVLDDTVNISAVLSADSYAIIQAVKAGEDALTITDATLGVSGSVANNNLSLSIDQGSTATLAGSWNITTTPFAATLSISAANLHLVNATLKQLSSDSITNPITFTGQADFVATTVTANASTVNDVTSGTASFQSATMTLSGTIADTQSNSFNAVLAVTADGKNTDGSLYQFTDLQSVENFDNLGFTLTLTGNLLPGTPGLTDATHPATVVITGDQNSLKVGSGMVTLSYGGKSFAAVATANAVTGKVDTVTISENDVKLVLNLAAKTGTINVDGVPTATVQQNGTSFSDITVTYSDGTFSSL
jgi:hypothetical protein